MKITRARRPDRFTVLDNRVIEDRGLSFRALGLLTYLLSRPDGWETDSSRLAKQRPGGEGRDAVRRALSDLESAGYLVRRRVQDAETGRWGTVTEVLDAPKTDSQASVDQSSEIQPSGDQASLVSTETKNEHQHPHSPPSRRPRRRRDRRELTALPAGASARAMTADEWEAESRGA